MASSVVCSILECFIRERGGRESRKARKIILWWCLGWYLISWTMMRRLSVGLVVLALYVVPHLKVSCEGTVSDR